MKILILPTYFPTIQNPIVGSQVKEQAELLQFKFDIKVIHCLSGMGLMRYLTLLIFPFLRKYIYKECTTQLQGGSLQTLGVYYYYNNILSDRLNLYNKKKAYNFVFNKLQDQDWQPNLIHARGTDFAGFIAYYLSIKHNVPYILSENTAFLIDDYISNFKIKEYRSAINKAKSLLFVSNFLKQIILMNGIGMNSIHYVTGNAVDETLFKIQTRNKEQQKFKIFTTGYNSHIKDFDTFFRAIRQVIDNGYTNIEVIIGVTYAWSDGNYQALIEKSISYGVRQFCEFKLKIPRSEMPLYFNQSNCYVQTSIIETFGISCLEAIACGTPVISTNNGGVNDIINKSNGIIVPVGDHQALADSIIKLLTNEIIFDPQLVSSSIHRRYSKLQFTNQLCEIYLQNL